MILLTFVFMTVRQPMQCSKMLSSTFTGVGRMVCPRDFMVYGKTQNHHLHVKLDFGISKKGIWTGL